MPRTPSPAKPSATVSLGLLDAVSDAIFVHDAASGQVLDVNQAACTLYGWHQAEFRELRTEDLSSGQPPYTQAEALEWIHRATAEGPQRFEWHARDRRGRLFWVEVSLCHIALPEGARVVASVRDITSRRRAEEALRESDARFQGAFRHAGIGMSISSPDGAVLQANRSLCRLLGYSEEELQSRNFFDLTHPEDREDSRARLDRLLAGEVQNYQLEKRYIARDGAVILASVSVSGVRDAAGKPLYQICQVEDITGRRRAEQERTELERELSRSRALETVGRLAGGVAHDFNNLLGSILGCVYVTRLQNNWEEAAAEIDRIQDLCRRGGDLTRQLLTVARRGSGEEVVVDVAAELEELRSLLEHTLPRDIRLRVEVGAELPPVRADRSLFASSLLNLALNARDAMPSGGTLRIRAARRRDEAGAEWLEVTVEDTGAGIPEALQEQIFEPFFTTKAVGAGTGLGLSTVQAAVQQWGGSVEVASQPGRGSTFAVRLPARVRSGAAAPAAGTSLAAAHPLTPAPVLVVEDEDGIARLMTLALETHGYRALRAHDGLEALEQLRARPGAVGLVVLDLLLPELGGEQVHRLLTGLAPEVPVLLVSGREDLARKIAPRGPFLVKPFTAEEFLEGVNRALGAAP